MEIDVLLFFKSQKLGRLQQTALSCLVGVAKSNPKQLYPYWSDFIASSSLSSSTNAGGGHVAPSLISVINHHELANVRIAACMTLIALLDGSKQYLSVAEET